MPLTEVQKTAYRDDGYLVVPDVVDAADLARLRMLVAEFNERSKAVRSGDAVFDVGPGHAPQAPQLRRLKDPVKQHSAFDALMRSDAIVDIVSELMGGAARFEKRRSPSSCPTPSA